MKKLRNIAIGLILINFFIACGGSDDGDDGAPPEPTAPPSAASLVFPENNTECNEGTILSETQSEITFRWNASENTDSYTVALKNLSTGNSQNINSTVPEVAITIDRGTPYSWSVTSKAEGTNIIAESAVWKFYNAGLALENHPPFPAEALFPNIGSSVPAGPIDLSWEANDLDQDISSYDLLLDQNNPPTTLLETTASNSFTFTGVSGTVYYWRVITTDQVGNASTSEVFQFKVD